MWTTEAKGSICKTSTQTESHTLPSREWNLSKEYSGLERNELSWPVHQYEKLTAETSEGFQEICRLFILHDLKKSIPIKPCLILIRTPANHSVVPGPVG